MAHRLRHSRKLPLRVGKIDRNRKLTRCVRWASPATSTGPTEARTTARGRPVDSLRSPLMKFERTGDPLERVTRTLSGYSFAMQVAVEMEQGGRLLIRRQRLSTGREGLCVAGRSRKTQFIDDRAGGESGRC